MFNDFKDKMSCIYSFSVKYKNQSLFMRFIGILLFFNKAFMTDFTTTIGRTIYFPSEEFVNKNTKVSISILSHELVHVQQVNKYSGILFSILYLFPQCLVVLALLAPFSLWFLLFLICAAPLPAPWRAAFEVDAYTMTLFVNNIQLNILKISPDKIYASLSTKASNIDNIYFKGSTYFFMWPFGVTGKFENRIKDIQDDVILGTDAIYDCVRQSYLNATSSYEHKI